MNPQVTNDNLVIFSDIVKKLMVVFGPDITIAKVKNVKGIGVDHTGNVTTLEGDPQVLLQGLITQLMPLSGVVVRKTVESVLSNNPELMAVVASTYGATVKPASPSIQGVNPDAPQSLKIGTDTPAVSNQSAQIQPQITGQPVVPPPDTNVKPVDVSIPNQESSSPSEFSKNDLDSLNKAITDLSNTPATDPSQK